MYWTGSLPEIILVFPMIPSGVSRCVCVCWRKPCFVSLKCCVREYDIL